MAGAIQQWPTRIQGACYVAVGGGVATLAFSLGGIASVTRNSAGNYTVTLKGPGVPYASGHSPILFATAIDTTGTIINCLLASATTITVLTFTHAGVAADASFSLLMLSSEREGGA